MSGWEHYAVWFAICGVVLLVAVLELIDRARHGEIVRRVEVVETDTRASLGRIEATLVGVERSGRDTKEMVQVIVNGHIRGNEK
ncbi:hypothetical protein AA0472_2338 [Acetobacter estunensis NRIC 0472]|uniref:Uncharacterized protein n=1 Tax=Acetobacter estunensis TaxID=104097 RepID=A0A967ED22_9PROT|nr:hypothetical protein [Acetobacter estunensis]NHO55253.1 hypothetical protein [Acetobacter estunensis]GBQ27169.1 hypothetical protein AA0472_2338 [Acetobacter estunensis NRIC 0472]